MYIPMLEGLSDEHAVLWLSTVMYAVTAGIALLRTVFRTRWVQAGAYILLWLAFGVQLAGLSIRGKIVGGCPLGNPFEITQFLVWSGVFLFLVTFPFVRLNLLGALVGASAAILSAVSLSVPSWDYEAQARLFGGNPWIELHAALAMFSYGMLGILALMSSMFLVQQYALKRKVNFPIASILPSVRELDILGSRLLIAGMSLMTLALGVGFLFWFQNADAISPTKLITTSIIWLAYIAVGVLRWRAQLAAKRFAQSTVLLFACIILSIGPISGDPISEQTEKDMSSVEVTH